MLAYLSKTNIEIIEQEINRFITNIEKDINVNKKSIFEYSDILLILSELLNQKNINIENDTIVNMIRYILSKIKSEMNNNSINIYSGISMFSNWGTLAFAINNINKKTDELNKLSRQMNCLLTDCLYNHVQYLKNIETCFESYDIISGPSGPLYYLIKETNIIDIEEYKEKLTDILQFLISFTNTYCYKNNNIINFHIKREKQFLESEKEIMKNGHINFGLAHGMIGVLVVLSEAKKRNFHIENIDIAINRILNLYEVFKLEKEDIVNFPTQLPLEDYISLNKDNINDMNASWCYGNISIVRCLMKVYKNNNDYKHYQYYKEHLIKILDQPLENYNLVSPIVCHGYSSPIIIQISAFIETKDKAFIKTLNRNISELLKKHKNMLDVNRPMSNEEDYYKIKYYDDRSLLNGEGGVILTILSSISKDVNFNKILMID